MRGEHSAENVRLAHLVGSSPHARGAPLAALKAVERSGIIPACAGSTHDPELDSVQRRDHPRMRGEHQIAQSACLV